MKLGGAEEESWMDCDLASYAENRLGELCDPFQWGERSRDRWRAMALLDDETLPLPRKRRPEEACYWIERDGRRVGTLALARFCLDEFVAVHSVYLRPQYRGRRIMADTLELRDRIGRELAGLYEAWGRPERAAALGR